MTKAKEKYNAFIEVIRENRFSKIIRVYPDGPRMKYHPGQYSSMGLQSELSADKIVRRAYSISCSIIDLASEELVEYGAVPFYESYLNTFKIDNPKNERLAPRLFALVSGDRIYYGNKIVGHYTLEGVGSKKNVLFISSETGEAPNNAIVNQILLEDRDVSITNILVGPKEWESLYIGEHTLASLKYPNYKFLRFACSSYNAFEQWITEQLTTVTGRPTEIGFELHPESCHVFLCGDPVLIGAPRRLGGWQYDYPDHGLIRLFSNAGFEVKSRFQDGSVSYETYW